MLGKIRVLAVAAVLVCAGCATSEQAPADTVATGTSPRAECAPASATVYFTAESPTVQPTTRPLLRDLLARGAACEAAGGELRSIQIVTQTDPSASRADADALVRERNRRVREVLVELGAPADRIRLGRAPRARDGAMMARRSEVTLLMY
mgnify:CR=1 FL=1